MTLYLPRHFEQNDPTALRALMHAHPLATWVCVVDGEPVINHLPLHLDTSRGEHGTLIGHVARANPVWQVQPTSSVCIFHGPQAYVTPSWYPTKRESGKVVPTWNYAVVHAQGLPRFIHDTAELHALVSRLTNRHEEQRAQPWSVDDAPPDYTHTMLKAIVGLEIEITQVQGKFKLSQNRLPVDQRGVMEGAAQGAEEDRLMAQAMAKVLPGLDR
ncbi:MAG: FMN-binding negative transcriptional regulator [Betaproteobacteria bacterium]